MNNDKGYFESSEFRELLAKYENSIKLGMSIYFGIDEFVDLLSYYLSIDKSEEAENVLEAAKRLHPTAPENTKMEIRLLLYAGEARKALELFKELKYIEETEKRLEKLLEEIKDAGDVRVMLTLESCFENVYAVGEKVKEEADENNKQREFEEEYIIIKNGSSTCKI